MLSYAENLLNTSYHYIDTYLQMKKIYTQIIHDKNPPKKQKLEKQNQKLYLQIEDQIFSKIRKTENS